MTRFAALAAALLAAVPAAADIRVPGSKRIPTDHKIETEKEYPDFTFYTIIGPDKVAEVKLHPKKPFTIAAAGRGGTTASGRLVAVPNGAAKGYKTEKEFHDTLAAGKVKGQLLAGTTFPSFDTIKESDPRTAATITHKIVRVDPKEGIVFERDAKQPKKDGKKPEEEESLAAPRGVPWAAGLAASASLVLAGLWLAGRKRAGR